MKPGNANFVRVALPVPLDREFDYRIPQDVTPMIGSWVRVRLGNRICHGVVTGLTAESAVQPAKLKPLLGLDPDSPPLNQDQISLARFVANYYQTSFGLALALLQPPPLVRSRADADFSVRLTSEGRHALLPAGARLQRRLMELLRDLNPHNSNELESLGSGIRRRLRNWIATGWIEKLPTSPPVRIAPALVLNAAQRNIVDQIVTGLGSFAPIVLKGITGSGKTAVYLQAAAAAISRAGQVLLLVPEINLTPQLAQQIRGHLPGVRMALLHSSLSRSERSRQWRSAAAGAADLILGTRLAVFTPMPRLALIVVDEEHDTSFKQQDNIRYHARDVALFCAKQRGIPIVLGSATPALETYRQGLSKRYRLLELRERATGAPLPSVALVPQEAARGNEGLSDQLLQAIQERLTLRQQSLIFINRRGYSPSLLCRACGWAASCRRCTARLVVHAVEHTLACHHCGDESPLIGRCPECGNQDLLPLGYGTQRLEAMLTRHFPQARLLRIDRDSTRRRMAWADMLTRIQQGEVDILVGTQMLVKGHDFPALTLVGVLGADNALYSADFRATERIFSQLLQVAGRAGRASLPGQVIVQTDYPGHPVYQALATQDYDTLARTLLEERKQAHLPPYTYLALLKAEAPQRKRVDAFLATAHSFAQHAAGGTNSGVTVFNPIAARMERRAGLERAQMLFAAGTRPPLLAVLREVRARLSVVPGAARVRYAFDVDPMQID